MQIVRDLGGYTLGRSDLVRRAMSKKKQSVMEEERRNFVYGNPEEKVPGCAARGIDEKVASGIYDTMMDFAKYAFNKSHAACYAVVAYQTAWLKYYYPMEFMAALMTSVIDHPAKVASYILACRAMKIRILPPDINEGEAGFSVSKGAGSPGGPAAGKGAGGQGDLSGISAESDLSEKTAYKAEDGEKGSPAGIRYALTAIKGVGRPVIDAIVRERRLRGPYKDLRDFLTRMQDQEKDVGRRTVESFIKAGALDSLGGTRKQLMSVYVRILDSLQASRKHDMAGQMTLFDIADEEDKKDYEIRMPDVGEFPDELRLSFEKEVLGIYVSGHPLDAYEGLWRGHVTAKAADFLYDEDAAPGAGTGRLADRQSVTIGGIIAEKQVRYTKNGQVMAVLQVEDLTGTVEVLVFASVYEECAALLEEDGKVFITGRVSLEEEKDSKLIAGRVTAFDDVPRRVWLRFPTFTEWKKREREVLRVVADNGGRDQVVIYIRDRKAQKVLPPGQGLRASGSSLALLYAICGEENVVLV